MDLVHFEETVAICLVSRRQHKPIKDTGRESFDTKIRVSFSFLPKGVKMQLYRLLGGGQVCIHVQSM